MSCLTIAPNGTSDESEILQRLTAPALNPSQPLFAVQNPSAGATLLDPSGLGTILNDDTGVFGQPGYYTTTPCRVFDSRLGGGPLVDGVPVVVAIGGTCGVPAAGHVVALNLTAVTPTAAGELAVYPADSAASPLATISFSAGRTRANNVLVALSPSGELAALGTLVGGGSVHLAIDVVGWFDAATETAPDSGTAVAGRARFAPDTHATPPTLTLEPLANDGDPDSQLSLLGVSASACGSVSMTGDAVDFTPHVDLCDVDRTGCTVGGDHVRRETLTYQVSTGVTESIEIAVVCPRALTEDATGLENQFCIEVPMLDDAAAFSVSVVRSFTQTVSKGELFEKEDGAPQNHGTQIAVDLSATPFLSDAAVLCFEPLPHDHSAPSSAAYTNFEYQACVPNAVVDPGDTGHTCSAVRDVELFVTPIYLPPTT